MSSFQVFASTVQQAGDPVVVSSTLAPHLRLRTNPPFPSTVRRAYPSAPVPQVNPTAPYGTRAGTHPPGPIPFPRPLGGLPAENWLMREVAALQANIIRLPTGSLAIYQNRGKLAHSRKIANILEMLTIRKLLQVSHLG